jgi:hypothetical protein
VVCNSISLVGCGIHLQEQSVKITIIGDIHGKTGQYVHLLRKLEGQTPHATSIQLGDMGLGFSGVGLPPPGTTMPTGNHTWFRGNHDDPQKCRRHPNYRGDWGYDKATDIFHVAGAFSIDRDHRIEGVSWWPDEELSYSQLEKVIDEYIAAKPRIMLSHDCPEVVNKVLLYDLMGPYFLAKQACGVSRTCGALEAMLDAHQPEEWIFGHYHVDKEVHAPGYKTKFRCVAELSTYEVEV